jgi:phosphatidylserine/phosphatidylglycerophosphate/cardiolipin synthase-like enzyme
LTVLHAKSIVVDDIVFVGSSNLDPRSLRINFEIMLRIQNVALAAAARQQFEADLSQHAIPITRDELQPGRSGWKRLKQRLAYWVFARLDPELAAIKLRAWRLRKDRFVQRAKRVRRAGARQAKQESASHRLGWIPAYSGWRTHHQHRAGNFLQQSLDG